MVNRDYNFKGTRYTFSGSNSVDIILWFPSEKKSIPCRILCYLYLMPSDVGNQTDW